MLFIFTFYVRKNTKAVILESVFIFMVVIYDRSIGLNDSNETEEYNMNYW